MFKGMGTDYGADANIASSIPSNERGPRFRHVLLLQWLYNRREEPVYQSFQKKAFFQFGQQEILAFAKQLIPIYSPRISCLSLRYALLVFVGVITSGGLFAKRRDNACRARCALAEQSHSAFEEGDAFEPFSCVFSRRNCRGRTSPRKASGPASGIALRRATAPCAISARTASGQAATENGFFRWPQ